MLKTELSAKSFDRYPPQARDLAQEQITLLEELPPVFRAILLREVSEYDWRFPAEKRMTEDQFQFLSSLATEDRARLLRGFAGIELSEQLRRMDAVGHPQQFMDALSAYLWSSGQIGAFDTAADEYVTAWHQAKPDPQPAMPRLCTVLLNDELRKDGFECFRKLRPLGTYFPRVETANAWSDLMAAVRTRIERHQIPYQHWFVDGTDSEWEPGQGMTTISWVRLAPLREKILERMRADGNSGNGNAESTRRLLAETTPSDLNAQGMLQDEVLRTFEVRLFTEGSGTQIFSTTFVQWTARELLRRAQPCTLILQYGCRRRERPMNEMLLGGTGRDSPDPAGSLMDADMGSYYTWINLQRLTGSAQATFVAWSQAQRCAVAVGPGLPRGVVSSNVPGMKQLLGYLA